MVKAGIRGKVVEMLRSYDLLLSASHLHTFLAGCVHHPYRSPKGAVTYPPRKPAAQLSYSRRQSPALMNFFQASRPLKPYVFPCSILWTTY